MQVFFNYRYEGRRGRVRPYNMWQSMAKEWSSKSKKTIVPGKKRASPMSKENELVARLLFHSVPGRLDETL